MRWNEDWQIMYHSMVLETVPEDFPSPSCEEPVFWEQKYSNSRHTVSFKFQNIMAGSTVTSGTFISILLFSETSLTSSQFWERFLVCRTRTLHTLSPGTNTFITIMPSFPCSPWYVITLQMCLWRCKLSRAFYACATAWQDINPLLSRSHIHHVNTVQSVS